MKSTGLKNCCRCRHNSCVIALFFTNYAKKHVILEKPKQLQQFFVFYVTYFVLPVTKKDKKEYFGRRKLHHFCYFKTKQWGNPSIHRPWRNWPPRFFHVCQPTSTPYFLLLLFLKNRENCRVKTRKKTLHVWKKKQATKTDDAIYLYVYTYIYYYVFLYKYYLSSLAKLFCVYIHGGSS